MYKWFISSTLHKKDDQPGWLEVFISNPALVFEHIVSLNSSDRSRRYTQVNHWLGYLKQAIKLIFFAYKDKQCKGIICFFTQIPLFLGVWKRLTRSKIHVVVHCFNFGKLPLGLNKKVCSFAYSGITKFIVHSQREVQVYAEHFHIPIDKFEFIHLQSPTRQVYGTEAVNSPFVLALGSAKRDYQLFFSVMEMLNIPAVVVVGKSAISGLVIPKNVRLLHDVSMEDCTALMQRSRFMVTPIIDIDTGAGQVTVSEGMRCGKAQIATNRGVGDYIRHEIDGLLVEPNNFEQLKTAILLLWENKALCDCYAASAKARATEEFSDEAAAKKIENLLLKMS